MKLIVLFPIRVIAIFIVLVLCSLVRVDHKSISDATVFRTWLVNKSFTSNVVFDDYFRTLPKDLSRYGKVVTLYATFNIGSIVKFFRTNVEKSQYLSISLLTPFDVLLLIYKYVFFSLVVLRRKYYFRGKCINAKVQYSLFVDYLATRGIQAFIDRAVCQKLKSLRIRNYIYVYENQSWEKLACKSFLESDVVMIGYQSSGFSPLFLNFYPTSIDASRSFSPDYILTVGQAYTDYISTSSKQNSCVKTFAALRFDYPNSGAKYNVKPFTYNKTKRIMYAFSVHIDSYASIICDLIEVFDNSNIMVDLKFHPLFNAKNLKKRYKMSDNFDVVSSVDMKALSEVYDCIIFNDNSFGLESLIGGVVSYQYSKGGTHIDDRFVNFTLYDANLDYGKLEKLKNAIEGERLHDSLLAISAYDYVNYLYSPYTESSFQQFRLLLNHPIRPIEFLQP